MMAPPQPCDTAPDTRLVIGVCTRQRNALLRRLLDCLWQQTPPPGYRVEVIVIDNNDTPSAQQALADLPAGPRLSVIHEPQIGLAYARNRALDAASARNADWFLGLDDDEWVAPDWLAQMVAGLQTIDSPILIAPCRYIHDTSLSPFLRPRQPPAIRQGQSPAILGTSNFAMHACVFDPARGPGLRFDPAHNECGGEDLEFFLRAQRAHGLQPASWPHALAFEDWTGPRARLGYRLSRSLRNHLVRYQVAWRHRQLGYDTGRMARPWRMLLRTNRLAVYGLGGLVTGLALWPLQPRRARHLIGDSLERLAVAGAIIPFILGHRPKAYGAQVGVT